MRNILVLIDIQKEYTTEGRPFYLQGIEFSLIKCRELLDFARSNEWEILHVQHSNGHGAVRFNPDSEYFDFVNGFKPKESEKLYIKSDFSCYSNSDFADYIENAVKLDECSIYLIGYNSVMCCLSTLEEARRRKHKMVFVEDASLAKSIEDVGEIDTHKFMVNLYKAKGLATITTFQDVVKNDVSHAKSNLFLQRIGVSQDANVKDVNNLKRPSN